MCFLLWVIDFQFSFIINKSFVNILENRSVCYAFLIVLPFLLFNNISLSLRFCIIKINLITRRWQQQFTEFCQQMIGNRAKYKWSKGWDLHYCSLQSNINIFISAKILKNGFLFAKDLVVLYTIVKLYLLYILYRNISRYLFISQTTFCYDHVLCMGENVLHVCLLVSRPLHYTMA